MNTFSLYFLINYKNTTKEYMYNKKSIYFNNFNIFRNYKFYSIFYYNFTKSRVYKGFKLLLTNIYSYNNFYAF